MYCEDVRALTSVTANDGLPLADGTKSQCDIEDIVNALFPPLKFPSINYRSRVLMKSIRQLFPLFDILKVSTVDLVANYGRLDADEAGHLALALLCLNKAAKEMENELNATHPLISRQKVILCCVLSSLLTLCMHVKVPIWALFRRFRP